MIARNFPKLLKNIKKYYVCLAGPAVTLLYELFASAEGAKVLKISRDRTLSNPND